MKLGTVEQALADLHRGRPVLVADDEQRENEGDLVAVAEHITPDLVNFMATHGRGLVCLALTAERCRTLELHPMAERNTEPRETAFTVTIDAGAEFGVRSGASAADRARTIRAAIDPGTRAADLRRPGHVMPLRSRPRGVLERRGQTEASVDLARLAGLYPAGVICEVLAPDGSMMRRPGLERFAHEHGLTFITVAQVVDYRLRHERLVERAGEACMPTEFGEFRVIAYDNAVDEGEHIALVYGDIRGRDAALVRVHSRCLTGEAFRSHRCDCGWQLETALALIAAEGAGAVVYLDQEGRGIGLLNKLRAYQLQDRGYDTVEANTRLGFPADARDFRVAAQILRDLDVRSVQLLTNNPRKRRDLEAGGVQVTRCLPLVAPANEVNRRYLRTKHEKLGHTA